MSDFETGMLLLAWALKLIELATARSKASPSPTKKSRRRARRSRMQSVAGMRPEISRSAAR